MNESRSDEAINEKLDKLISQLVKEVMAEGPLLDEETDEDSDEDADRDADEVWDPEEAELQKLEVRVLRFVDNQVSQESAIPSVLYACSKRLHEQYNNSRCDFKLIKTAVICCRIALALSPEDSPDRIVFLHQLGPMLKEQYEHTGYPAELDEAVAVAREVLDLSQGHDIGQLEMRLTALDDLADVLDLRYVERKDPRDLEEACEKAEMAVNSTADSTRRAIFQTTLSKVLKRRYESSPDILYIDKAIAAAEEAVRSVPEDYPDHATSLNNLSLMFHTKYEHDGDVSHLEKGIKKARAAVRLESRSQDRAAMLSNLSMFLGTQYRRSGDMKDLNEAVDSAQEAVDLMTQQEPRRAIWLNNLANMYSTRSELVGEMSDMEAAIRSAQEAVDSCPKGTSLRSDCSYTLSMALSRKYDRNRDKESLDRATDATQDACQYEETGKGSHLDKAVEKARQAVMLTPKKHPAYVAAVGGLAGRLHCLYKRKKATNPEALQILKEAIKFGKEAVNLSRDDDTAKANRLRNLASKLRSLHDHTGKRSDEDEALAHFVKASRTRNGIPFNRIECARAAVAILINRGGASNWIGARTLTEEALELIPLVCRRYTSLQDQQHAIMQVSGLAADAASLSLKFGEVQKALQQLEFGRGLILGYMIDNRSDLSALREDNEGLAKRYETLRLKAYWEIDNNLTGAVARQRLRERKEAVGEIEDCVSEIRKLPGYEQFQKPPEMDELKILAAEGPIVVVNVTEISADAIILTHDGVNKLHIPGLSPKTAPLSIQEKFRRYASTRSGEYDDGRDITSADKPRKDSDQFSWLWTNCVRMVLDELKSMALLDPMSSEPPRVWWIGCGIASAFPFHAAGINFGSTSVENTLSRVVPSYTPTIKALGYSRWRASTREQIGDDEKRSILLITMPMTCGQKDLPGVDDEKAAIKKACKGVYFLEELRLPTASEVLEKIPQSSITHFACHGSSDPSNPSESHLLLQKEIDGKAATDKLTLSAVSAAAAQGRLAWIAFLSACSTAEVKASQFADEGLHLASAFQIAGFAHVIGALWRAHDDACARVAEQFYTELTRGGTRTVTNRSVAVALRHAVMQVRAQQLQAKPHGNHFPQWAPFVHFGA